MSVSESKTVVGVPQQILEKFLAQLQEEGVSAALVKRLRETIEGGSLSDTTLKKALLPDEPAP